MVLLPGAFPTTLSHIEPASLVAAQRGVHTTSWTPPLDIAAAEHHAAILLAAAGRSASR